MTQVPYFFKPIGWKIPKDRPFTQDELAHILKMEVEWRKMWENFTREQREKKNRVVYRT